MKLASSALALLALPALTIMAANDTTTRHSIAATDCGTTDNDGVECHANTDEINLATDMTIDFEIGGRTVTFEQNPETMGDVDRWSGTNHHIDGDATIVAKPDEDGNKIIYASLVDMERGEICQVGPDADGNEMVRCTQSSQFPDEEDPEDRRATRKLRSEVNNTVTRDLQGLSTFDIMVVWTRKAECFRSGLGSGCSMSTTTENNMRGLIDVAVQETNDAYAASGVNARLRLVHAYRDLGYVEPSSNTFGTTLSRLQGKTDGYLDDVHTKRTQYGADVVAMLIEGGGACGIGYVGPSKDWMFSVTGWSCATGHYTFGHEVGHNLGCHHDRGTRGCPAGYNYGYRDPAASFRTVMAYNCVSGQCDNNAGGGCTRIKRFSTPLRTYNGKTTGLTNLADCTRHINNVRAEVEDYYLASCPNIEGYNFVPNKDSWGNDMTKLTSSSVQGIANWCTNNHRCKGFNTNGWVKDEIRSSLYTWSGSACDGLYVKQHAPISTAASGYGSWAAAGMSNDASGDYASISGGSSNTASGDYSSIGGGRNNVADGYGSVVTGGASNEANGLYGYVGGGISNQANGIYSAAWGSNAHATHGRAAVFDFSYAGCDSEQSNEVRICAENGLVINDKNIEDEFDMLLQTIQGLEARVSALEGS